LSDWLAGDPNRLDASLYEFAGVSTDAGTVCSVDELRADVSRFADMLLGDALDEQLLRKSRNVIC
jgi:hypothetical protein